MSTFAKPLAVLLISILIFAGIAFLADMEFLDFVQARFYNPSIVKTYITENTKDAELVNNYIYDLQKKFGESLNEPAVRNSFLYNQSAEDIFERSRIYGILIETTSGLQSVQFIDANGIRIHFSTSSRDIISQSSTSTSYRNYTEDRLALPYETVSVLANGSPKFTMDENGERIIFSYPFNDSMDVYHGTALFSVSSRAIAERLIAEGRLKVNENVSVIGEPPGVLFGSPDSFKAELQSKVSEIWSDGIKDRLTISSEDSGMKFSLFSFKSDRGILFGRLVNDELFYISDSMKIVLYISMFVTFYLLLYFVINFKPNPVTVVRNRIRRLRETLFEQLYEDKSTQEKIRWLLELEQRRDEIKSELKYKIKIDSKTEESINKIIDKSWDEIIAVITASAGHAALALKISSLDTKEIVQMSEYKTQDISTIEEAESIYETEEITNAEEIDEIEEVDEIDELYELEKEYGKTKSSSGKGLLQLASKFEKTKIASSKGLLRLASEYVSEPAEIYPTRGLLARAIREIHGAKKAAPKKGLLALASEIEFSHKTEDVNAEDNLEDSIDEIINMDIVSPFVSMFSSLDDLKMDE